MAMAVDGHTARHLRTCSQHPAATLNATWYTCMVARPKGPPGPALRSDQNPCIHCDHTCSFNDTVKSVVSERVYPISRYGKEGGTPNPYRPIRTDFAVACRRKVWNDKETKPGSACGHWVAPVPMLLSAYLYICNTGGSVRPHPRSRHAWIH